MLLLGNNVLGLALQIQQIQQSIPTRVRLAVQILDLSTPAAAGAIAREQCLGPSSPDSTDSTEHPYAQLAGTIQPD